MKAKKSLGQNFLKSNAALRQIIEAGEISHDDIILEIGPGKGALTKKLLAEVVFKKAKCVIAIEKDIMLLSGLKHTLAAEITEGTLILIEGDILELDIEKVIGKQNYKIIANIPYNITGAILKKFLTAPHQPTDMVLMVQHEVAKRILARDGKESILSISVKAYGAPKMVMKVPARYFSPSPKVDSAIIAIKNISRKTFTSHNEEKFWGIIHAGFAHKRKRLLGNLKGIVAPEKSAGLPKDIRAENLTLEDWLSLS
jgi:16S rRNA (adenine1518-N6/adenine1519-N6)-dimethyltransferase